MKYLIALFKLVAGWFSRGEVVNMANAWPTTGAGSLATGRVASGITTLRWGSGEVLTALNGTTFANANVAIVTRVTQRALVDNIKLPNGDGVTISRVMVVDGVQWDLTVRDNAGATTAGITGRPQIGTSCTIVDMAGLIDAVGEKYTATVVEAGYETAPKQAGELTITVENLVLIESQVGT